MVTRATKPAAFKVVLLGEGRVGKTSLVLRYVHGIFSPHQPATVQAAFLMKQLRLANGSEIVLSIWDTAGQERFHALGPIYYRDADAALLVYDVTDANSLERVKQWVAELRLMGPQNMALVVAANKTDLLTDLEEGSLPELLTKGQEYAEEIGAIFIQTSAKEGIGVDDAFFAVATEVAKNFSTKPERIQAQSAPLANRKAVLVVDDDEDIAREPTERRSTCCT